MLLAGIGDDLRAIALRNHHERRAVGLEFIDIRVHSVGGRRPHRTAGIAFGRLGRAGVENRMVFEVVGHRFACVEPRFQLRVGDVASHDNRSFQIYARRNGIFRQFLAHRIDAFVEVDDNRVLALAGLRKLRRNQFGRVRVHFFEPNAVAVDFRLDVAVGRARNAHSDGTRSAVARQSDDADVVRQMFAAELCAKPDFMGFLQQFLLQVDVAEGASRLVARRGQRVVVFNRREFHGQQVFLRRSAADDKRDVVGRTGRRAERLHLLHEEGQQRSLVLNRGLCHWVEIGLVRRTAAFRHHHEVIFRALASLDVDLRRQVAARVHLVVHRQRRVLRIAQVVLRKRVVNTERQGFLVRASPHLGGFEGGFRPDLLTLFAVDNRRARVLTERQDAFRSHLGIAQELQRHVFVVFRRFGVAQNSGHLQVVFTAQHKLHIVERLLSQQRQCLARHLHDFLALELGSRYALFRQQAILGFVLAQLEHGRILKFRFCCHNIVDFAVFFCKDTKKMGIEKKSCLFFVGFT